MVSASALMTHWIIRGRKTESGRKMTPPDGRTRGFCPCSEPEPGRDREGTGRLAMITTLILNTIP
jgi:hypothetical protein